MLVKRPMFLALVIWIALIVRLLFVSKVHFTPVSDFEWYFSQGMAIANGHGYRYQGQPTAYFPIGYPLFLAGVFRIFGIGWWPAVLANVVLNSLTAGLVYLVAEFLWVPSAALISGLAMALYVPHVEWSSVICSEVIFSFLFLLTGYLWLRSGKSSSRLLIASGIVLGLASLVRPVTLLFPAVYLIYAIVRRFGFWSSVGKFALVLVVMVMTISPLTIRNYEAFHQLVPVSANGGVNLWQGNNPDANGAYFWPLTPKLNPFLNYKSQAVAEDPIATHMALSYIEHHPLRTIKMGFVKWHNLFRGVNDIQLFSTKMANPPVSKPFIRFIAGVSQWSYRVSYVLGAIGMLLNILNFRRYRKGESSILWLGILYYVSVFFIFPAWSRMRAPLSPWVIVFDGWGVWSIVIGLRKKLHNPLRTPRAALYPEETLTP